MDKAKNTLESWWTSLQSNLPNIVAAVVVIACAALIGMLLARLARNISMRAGVSKLTAQLMGKLAFIAVLVLGSVIALNILDLSTAAASILAGAGVLGLVLGFALQDIAASFIAGVVIAFQKPMKVGDLVETNDHFGVVKKVSLRMTQIETLTGQEVYIPNKDVFLGTLVDYTTLGRRRIDLGVGVAYSTDLARAQKIASNAVKKLDTYNEDYPVEVFYNEFGDSSINFTLRFWINFKKQPDYLGARSDAIIAIKKAFDKADINIPFPIRTLGGEVNLKK